MEEIVGRYRGAFLTFLSPFVRSNEHVLENYLVNYAFRTLFPFGHKKPDQKLVIDAEGASVWNEYTLLVTHYAIIRTVLVGMAGLHRNALSIDHVVRLIQSYTKAFQHSGTFASTVFELLKEKGMKDSRVTASLLTDQTAAGARNLAKSEGASA
jgi:lysine-N-methylase